MGSYQPDPASSRDRHLFGPGPKRILALSGGGVRGAITVAFLKRIEEMLDAQAGKAVRLADYFDLIGGTSTGALIAGGLALGYRVDQITRFYTEHAGDVFAPHGGLLQLPFLQSKFDVRGLRSQLETVIGERRLGTPDLITGFACITKRIDTGSVWMIANNPRSPYWEDGETYIGNKHYSLANLVRASTAAPQYFDPELLPIGAAILPPELEGEGGVAAALAEMGAELIQTGWDTGKVDWSQYGLFVDGGVSPYNNPSLALLQLVSLKAYGLNWPLGPDNLSITSVGTGVFRPRLVPDSLGFGRVLKLAVHALISMMADAEKQSMTLLQWLGETAHPRVIDSEIGTLAGEGPPGGKLFRFAGYDVELEPEWLKRELEQEMDAAAVADLRRIDNAGAAKELYRIGQIAAERQILTEDWT
jgi:predicted acylesterase/phospholipase RssA